MGGGRGARGAQARWSANQFGLCPLSGHKAKRFAPNPSAGGPPSLDALATNAGGRTIAAAPYAASCREALAAAYAAQRATSRFRNVSGCSGAAKR